MLSEGRRKIFNVYKMLPPSVKRVVSFGGRLIPAKMVYGRNFFSTYDMIKQTQFALIDEMKLLSRKALGKMLLHAFSTTPYYRREMIDKGIKDNDIRSDPENVLKSIGFISKEIIRGEEGAFISSKSGMIPSDYTSTGGTSGEPFYFYINSNRSSQEWAFIVDQWSRVGFVLGARRATFRGDKILGAYWEDDWITKERKFSSFKLTDEYMNKIWSKMREYKPEFIYAYPSTVLSLCQYMEREGKELPGSVRAILIGSENIYAGQREYIEEICKKRVFAWYGHSEKVVLAGYCEFEDFYHAYPQYGYVEFINGNGEAARPGETAEIVGTGFINTVMPFIRYRTGDYCTYLGNTCPSCGRNYPIFADVRGRWTQEVLYGKKGNKIPMSAINIHSNVFRNVFRFQFFQEEHGESTLRLVAREGFGEKDKIAIEKEFNDKFGESVRVTVKVVEDIPLTKRGKYKFIDQRLDA